MDTDQGTTQVLDRPAGAEQPSKPPRDPMRVLRMVRGIIGLALVVGVATVILVYAGSLLRTTLVDLGVPTRPPAGEDQAVATSPTSPPSTAAPGLPAGLTCDQLADHGLGYAGVVAYWIRSGSPESLGESRPCTDVFDQGEIDAFISRGEGQSSKATCQDLSDDGLDYTDTVAYFLRKDRPKRLDPDGDGWPCTDVYPQAAVDAFVHFDRQVVTKQPAATTPS
ncbi:MAG: hypothetical protein K1X95_05680 [Acidimicrobiia bacterium]|nr:hypothetical protein [Acidimicrobiia bacterium]